jgi:hypothetical protein
MLHFDMRTEKSKFGSKTYLPVLASCFAFFAAFFFFKDGIISTSYTAA